VIVAAVAIADGTGRDQGLVVAADGLGAVALRPRGRVAARERAGSDGRRGGGAGRAVVDFRVRRRGHGDRAPGDVRRGRGRGVERVVAGVGAGDIDARNRDGLAGANVLVGEGGGRVARGQRVANDAVIRKCDRGGRGAVVTPVHAGRADGQRP